MGYIASRCEVPSHHWGVDTRGIRAVTGMTRAGLLAMVRAMRGSGPAARSPRTGGAMLRPIAYPEWIQDQGD
jgi:hypothetical protein